MNETQASQLPVYAGNDLGAVWRSSATAFRLWAPTACSAALHRFATGTDAEPEAADLGTLAMQRSEAAPGTWNWRVTWPGSITSMSCSSRMEPPPLQRTHTPTQPGQGAPAAWC